MIRKAIIIAALLATVAAWADMEWQTAIGQKDQVTKGLVAYWAMRNSGTTVYDEWTGGYNGTAVNSPTFGTTYAAVGQGASFAAASSQYITVPTNGFATASTFTISAWIKPVSNGLNRALFATGDTSGSLNRLGILIRPTHKIGMYSVQDDISTTADLTGGTTLTAGTWVHVVCTFTAGDFDAWVNGVEETMTQEGSAAESRGVSFSGLTGSKLTTIGTRRFNGGYGLYFAGQIDELRIYNRTLTADEIKQLYRMGAIPKGIK
jgi:hypothetical protein